MLHLKAYAKLNLTLDILRKRPDGFHDLAMVMQSISLADDVSIAVEEESGIRCESNLGFLPSDERNLAVKAALIFARETGIELPGLRIRLEKRIPACAGMAGGSSDAAAVLRGLRELLAPTMSAEELERIAAFVGSDVPYCVRGTTSLAEGRGEVLTDLAPLPPCWFVICKPDFPISTPELFSCVNVKKIAYHPDTRGMMAALSEKDLAGVARRMFNVFESVLPRKYEEVFAIKHRLLELGAMNAAMSGSGPTVYGIFDDKCAAEQAYAVLKADYEQCYLAEPVAHA
ncbi:MAG: 4-(cytidine 5'-diphospho)-2-C-methyl-D-erythritol kinase [Oscillospiraceae bacterium]|nr:4-(cytidine 5'-diphospho)-2-C-methyl-D-erythritol kinase [Oscillospiraceae bacterium]